MAKKTDKSKAEKGYTLKELRKMAADRNISGRSKMKKAELIAALELAQEPAPKPGTPGSVPHPVQKEAVKEMAGEVAAPEGVEHGGQRSGPSRPLASTVPAKVEEPKGVFLDWGPDVPKSYQQDTVSLLVKDPEWLYACWELSGEGSKRMVDSLKEIEPSRSGDARAVLRLEREGGGFVDVETGVANSWYLKVDAGRTYRAVIGFKDTRGGFHAVTASKFVKVPTVGLSETVDAKWMVVRHKLDELLRYMDGFPVPGSLFAVEAQSWRMVELSWSGTVAGPESSRD